MMNSYVREWKEWKIASFGKSCSPVATAKEIDKRVARYEAEAKQKRLAASKEKQSKIRSIANSISRHISRKDAFAMAKKIVKEGSIEVKVAGVSFGSRQTALRRLTAYRPSEITVTLSPEPENPIDSNAIAVMVSVNGGSQYCIGYVPAESTGTVRAVKGDACIHIIKGKIYGARLAVAV